MRRLCQDIGGGKKTKSSWAEIAEALVFTNSDFAHLRSALVSDAPPTSKKAMKDIKAKEQEERVADKACGKKEEAGTKRKRPDSATIEETKAHLAPFSIHPIVGKCRYVFGTLQTYAVCKDPSTNKDTLFIAVTSKQTEHHALAFARTFEGSVSMSLSKPETVEFQGLGP